MLTRRNKGENIEYDILHQLLFTLFSFNNNWTWKGRWERWNTYCQDATLIRLFPNCFK